MREIKFRYRIKNRKTDKINIVMLTLDRLEFHSVLPNVLPNIFDFFEWEILSRDECTGLPDKNNKLIFEGDDCKYGSYRGKIVFDYGCFIFDCDNLSMSFRDHDSKDFEIIDNPELLNQ